MAITKIQPNAIPSGTDFNIQLTDGSVVTADIADSNVTTAKIADANVTHAKLHSDMDLSGKTVTLPDLSQSLSIDGVVTVDRVINATTSADPWLKGVDGSNVETSFIKQSGEAYFGGNVGIGTKSPTRPFHVMGPTGATAGKIESPGSATFLQLSCNSQSNSDSGYIGYTSNKELTFWTVDTRRMTIDSSGKVGIGTSSPSSLLDVDKSQNSETNIEITNTDTGSAAQVRTKYTTDGGLFTVGKVSDAHTFSGAAYLWNVDATNMLFATNDTQRMSIDSSGNVGIGTTSPDVIGATKSLTIGSSDNGGTGSISLQSGWGNATYGRFYIDSGVLKIGNPEAAAVSLFTDNTERMRIDGNGNTVQYSSYRTSHSNSTGTLVFNLGSLGLGNQGQAEIWITAYENTLNRGFAKYMVCWSTKTWSPYYWYCDLQEIGRVNVNGSYGNPFVHLENNASTYTSASQSMTSSTGTNAHDIYVRTDGSYSGGIRVFVKLFQNP